MAFDAPVVHLRLLFGVWGSGFGSPGILWHDQIFCIQGLKVGYERKHDSGCAGGPPPSSVSRLGVRVWAVGLGVRGLG